MVEKLVADVIAAMKGMAGDKIMGKAGWTNQAAESGNSGDVGQKLIKPGFSQKRKTSRNDIVSGGDDCWSWVFVTSTTPRRKFTESEQTLDANSVGEAGRSPYPRIMAHINIRDARYCIGSQCGQTPEVLSNVGNGSGVSVGRATRATVGSLGPPLV